MAYDVTYLISLQDKFSSKLNTINNSTRSFDKTIGTTIARFATFAAVGTILTSSVKKIADFEEQVSNLSAITGLVGADLDYIKSKAIELGGATTKSSIDTVKAFKLIASAKPELLSNAAALASVTKEAIALSEASGLDLPDAATSLTDALNQFNLSADQSSRVINTLAAGSKFAAAEIPDLTNSLKEFGGIADSLNITLEESAAAVETLSVKGIKGQKAGMNLRNIFLRLATGVDKYNPKVVGLSKSLENLAEIQDDTNKLEQLFGRVNVIAGQTLIKQRYRFNDLTKAMTGTNIAYEQQKINTDNLNSDFKRLGSSWERLVLNLNSGSGSISKALRSATQFAGNFLDKLDEINKTDKQRATEGAGRELEAFKASLDGVKTEEEFRAKIAEEQKKNAFFLERNKAIVQAAGRQELADAKKLLDVGHALSRALFPNKTKKAGELVASSERLASLQLYSEQLRLLSREGLVITPEIAQPEITGTATEKAIEEVAQITSAAPKSFNITIEKFVENFSVNSENITQGANQVLDTFNNMWIKMIADAQAIGA